jgi:hypothetical protein
VVLLAGHSYNAFAPEGSQSVGKKLSSMGVLTVPADCLPPLEEGPTAWHFANQIMSAVAHAKKHPNLFLICVSNFSCTTDAFTHGIVASEMGSKPYLVLEIDAHTADAGVQTRLEAFLDIIRNWRGNTESRAQLFAPYRLAADGFLIRSNGERVALTDPRVKIYIPNFSRYHSESLAMAVRWMGLHTGEVPSPDRKHLDRGLQHTSGRECLPLPICIGQLLQIHDQRQPGEIAGFYMPRGGAPCVMDAYHDYFERFIAEQQLPDLFLADPEPENNYLGLDETRLSRNLSAAIIVADILTEIDHVLRVAGTPESVELLRHEWLKFHPSRSVARSIQ